MRFRELIVERGKPFKRKQGQHVFQQGDQDSSIYAITTGLMKAYYVTENGRENVKSFISEGGTIGSLRALTGEAPCSFSLVCLEDSELISINYSVVKQESQKDITLANELVEFLFSYGAKKEAREFELLCLSPEVRYRRLLQNSPELFERVTQHEISKYLGITPVALSRIKKRVIAA